MTVLELINKLKAMPPDAPVVFYDMEDVYHWYSFEEIIKKEMYRHPDADDYIEGIREDFIKETVVAIGDY